MNEELILDKVLELLKTSGVEKAYTKLIEELENLKKPSSRVYYFLSCLAAVSEKKEEAIEWLRISIEEKGHWSRTEIFEDSDLDSIRDDERFKKLISISNDRYAKALYERRFICTLDSENKNFMQDKNTKFALILHGNNQNNEFSKNYWRNVFPKDVEIHYLQSPDLESQNRFSWIRGKNYSSDIINILNKTKWNTSNQRIICGFSAGCNVILNLIESNHNICEKVILVAPWIAKPTDKLMENILKHDTEILIICGEKDSYCIDMVKKLELLIKTKNGKINVKYLKNTGHTYPIDLEKIIAKLLPEKETD